MKVCLNVRNNSFELIENGKSVQNRFKQSIVVPLPLNSFIMLIIRFCDLDIISKISEINDHTTPYNLSALIQKGEDLEASWLTAQCSNLWRMAGPLHFRVMHFTQITSKQLPLSENIKKCMLLAPLNSDKTSLSNVWYTM